jgi:hypothetical protein
MNPFDVQHQAFSVTHGGDSSEATRLFIEALKGFRKLITESRLREVVVTRAALIPQQQERAEELADQFLHALPGWIRDLHFDNFYVALTSYQMQQARMHWSLLASWSQQEGQASSLSLNLLRDQVCQRRQVSPAEIQESGFEQQDVLKRAEDILAIDGGNNTARRTAITIYERRLQAALERLTGKQDQQTAPKAISKMNSERKQRLHDSRKTVRRLRQHLRRAQSRADADVEEMLESYRQLSHYYIGVGELETAIKLTRRACRLLPKDESLRLWARGVRRLRRRG